MGKTHFFGQSENTPSVMNPPATLVTDPNDEADDTTGLMIKFGASAPADQVGLQIIDTDGSTELFEMFKTYAASYGVKTGSGYGVFDSMCGFDGTKYPVGLLLPSGKTFYAGTGDPNSTFTGTGVSGDIFWRIDGSVGTTVWYMCTSGGAPGTWNAYK
jgi:hypothetical protein